MSKLNDLSYHAVTLDEKSRYFDKVWGEFPSDNLV